MMFLSFWVLFLVESVGLESYYIVEFRLLSSEIILEQSLMQIKCELNFLSR